MVAEGRRVRRGSGIAMGAGPARLGAVVSLATIALLAALGPTLAASDRVGPGAQPGIPAAPNDPSTTSIAVGGSHGCALPGDGTVECWGSNYSGQLGDGLKTDPSEPAGDQVRPPVTVISGPGSATPLTGAIALAAGEAHTCALLVDTTVRCWGVNAAIPDGGPIGGPGRTGGQLGDGSAVDRPAPVTVISGPGSTTPLSGVTSISAGGDYTCAVLDDGTVACWGNAPQTAGLVPAAIMRDPSGPLSGVVAVTAGDHHACALLDDETVVCWGVNFFGQLGDQTNEPSEFPVQVTVEGGAALTGVVAVVAQHGATFGPNGIASGHTCALLRATTVVCWGVNDVSQLANGVVGEFEGRSWAGPVIEAAGATGLLSGVEALAAGWAHTCALLAGGDVSCWGLSFGEPPGNPGGFEGNGGPVAILSDAVAIAAGGYSCAVIGDGSVVCWIDSAQPPYLVPELLVAAPEPTPEPTATAGPPSSVAPTTGPVASPAVVGGGPVASAPPGGVTGLAVSFRDSVPRLADITLDLVLVAQSLLIAGVIMLLVPFPGALFNNTLEANYEEITSRVRTVRRRLGRPFAMLRPVDVAGEPARPAGAFWQSPLGIGAFVLITVVLITFLDPTFWTGATALATFAGLALGLVAMLLVFNLPSALAYRRSGTSFVVRALPGTLAIGVACVLISRLTDFQPGYLYGLVVGLAAAKASDAETPERTRAEGRTAAIGTVVTLLVAAASWLALGWLSTGPGAAAATSPITVALEAALATMVVAGFEGAAIGALPLKFFAGDKMRQWSFPAWLALGAIAGGLFLHILINPSSGYLADSSRTPLATIIVLLVLFGAGSVLFWAYFRFRPEPAAEGASS